MRLTPELRRRAGSVLIPALALLLVAAAVIGYRRTSAAVEQQVRLALNAQFSAMKCYLRVEHRDAAGGAVASWYFDPRDPDAAGTVRRLQERWLMADRNGQVMYRSSALSELDIESPSQIADRINEALASPDGNQVFWRRARDRRGVPYLVRSGVVFDAQRRAPYYVALAAPIAWN